MDYTIEQVNSTIEKASVIFSPNSYMGRKLAILKNLRDQMASEDYSLSSAQVNFLGNLMEAFSEEEMEKAQSWSEKWNTDEKIRLRGDIISKYYIAQHGWFMDIARTVQRSLSGKNEGLAPDYHMFHKMVSNEYAKKVWDSYKSPHRWAIGDLVCCRANAKIDGYTYLIRQQGIDVNKDPCMVLKSGSRPISSASKYDEKRGGCRWVSINPIGTTHVFNVMEKDLKAYKQPKKKATKRSKK